MLAGQANSLSNEESLGLVPTEAGLDAVLFQAQEGAQVGQQVTFLSHSASHLSTLDTAAQLEAMVVALDAPAGAGPLSPLWGAISSRW